MRATFYRLTLSVPALGLVAHDQSYLLPDWSKSSDAFVGPVCVTASRGVCRQVDGSELVVLSDPSDPRRTMQVQTLNGPAAWRHESAAPYGVPVRRVVVRGHHGVFLPNAGQMQFLQWEEPPGMNVLMFSDRSAFTEAELMTVAAALHVESITRDAVVPVSRVSGVPPKGMFLVKVKEYKPGANFRLVYLDPPSGPCFGFYAGSPCVPLIPHGGISYIDYRKSEFGIIAGTVPAGTKTIRVVLAAMRSFEFAPSNAGPSPSQQFFSRWLPSGAITVVTKIEALAWTGQVIAHVNLPH